MKTIKYLRLIFLFLGTIALATPFENAYAYSSPYFASRINEVNHWGQSGYQDTQIVAKGNKLYILDYFDGIVYKVSSDGTDGEIIAGKYRQGGYSPDGSVAANSTLESPSSIAVGNDGIVYIAEKDTHRVRAVLPNGILTTVAGNGTSVHPSLLSDAPDARQTSFKSPGYLNVGPDGNLYIYDSGVIRRVLSDGSTDHVGGYFGAAPNSNPYIEGGVSIEHALHPGVTYEITPFDFDSQGNIYYSSNSSIHKIDSNDGTVSTFVTMLGGASQTLEDSPVSGAALGISRTIDIDSQDRLWSGGGGLATGNAIQYFSLSDTIVKTAAGGGTIDLSLSTTQGSIVGTDLKLPSYIKGLSVNDEGDVYYIAPYITNRGVSSYYIGALSALPERDDTPPSIFTHQPLAPNINGWFNTDVVIIFDCHDADSGIASCSNPISLSTDGANQSVTGIAMDNAGNTNMATLSGINIDKTKPTATNGKISGWLSLIGAKPTITANVSDNLSGVIGGEYFTDVDPGQGNGTPMTYNSNTGKITAVVPIVGQSSGLHTIYMRSKDAAGNWSTTTYAQYYQL